MAHESLSLLLLLPPPVPARAGPSPLGGSIPSAAPLPPSPPDAMIPGHVTRALPFSLAAPAPWKRGEFRQRFPPKAAAHARGRLTIARYL